MGKRVSVALGGSGAGSPSWGPEEEVVTLGRSMSTNYESIQIESRTEWRAWLGEHHRNSPGVWVVTYKKNSPGPYVSYDEIVEEALAHGWVDSKGRRLDEERSQLLVTPRKPASKWSRPNKKRVERLTKAGLMTQAGIDAVEVAKARGTWSALDAIEDLIEPDDLRDALDRDPSARRNWDAFPRSTKRATLEWIAGAKKAPTRARRVGRTVELAAQNIRLNQRPRPERH
jgi:uncharacterized protein YdeI (YjbR/CyaY-like superfamily)